MQVFRGTEEIKGLPGSVVTDGMFDGMHLGHQRILKQVVSQAGQMNLPSVLLTYWPHPRLVLPNQDRPVSLLTGLDEKIQLAGELGIDMMVIIPFSKEFSQMSHVDFVRKILADTLKTRHLIIGYDHRFGNERKGSIAYLNEAGRQLGFGLTEIGRQEVEDLAVSSTRIRKALEEGNPELAASLLGRPYRIPGTIVQGAQRGRTIGFPTANIQPAEPGKLIPRDGVYASKCRVDNTWHDAMTNIGFRPTVDGNFRTIETHIFNFEGNLYDAGVEIALTSWLRPEKKFSNLKELQDQLAKDKIAATAMHHPVV